MKARLVKTRRKRFIVISTGLAALAAAGVLAADWPLVVTHYHLFRLDAARTREEAAPHLDALLARAHNPRSSALVAASLGTRREALTYWVFERIAGAAGTGPEAGATGPQVALLPAPPLAPVGPWIASLGERLERDDHLLRAWAHYVRWKDLEAIVMAGGSMESTAHDIASSVPGFLITVLAGPVFQTAPWPLSRLASEDPAAAEAWLRLFDLLRLARAFDLGAPLSGLTPIETPVTPRNALSGWRRVRTAFARVIAWRREHRPAEGGDAEAPRPADPLPGWRGSVPAEPVKL